VRLLLLDLIGKSERFSGIKISRMLVSCFSPKLWIGSPSSRNRKHMSMDVGRVFNSHKGKPKDSVLPRGGNLILWLANLSKQLASGS